MNIFKAINKFSSKQILLTIGIIVIAFNLRPAITSVGPVIGIIRDDIGLANWSAGLITSLPLLAFAAMSPIAPKLGNRFGNEQTMLFGLILLFLGISVRSIAFTSTLYVGTIFVGLGVAVCNVLLPGFIKDKFPTKLGLMTSIYTTCMSLLAATASGISIPLTKDLGLGWQKSLLSWAILALIGIMIWIYLIRTQKSTSEIQLFEASGFRMLRSPLAWQVTVFMGLQSFLFYTTVSWLPEILHSFGYEMGAAGWLLSFMMFISLPATFLAPILANKFKNQQGIIIIIGLCALFGYGGLLINGPLPIMMLSITLIGFALGGSISLALAMLGMRTANARQAGELSGMAQSFGYLLASIGPIFVGLLFDLSHSWFIPIITILIVSSFMLLFGLGASRDKYVLEN
ncbi:MFS transporter [Aquibacillus halophilus]|uniref:MFS transporter n=1 Tax=Aquibacillus halophilus TaxID=930132 RepID=A0A6A8DES1_9BACI|nr:MFS transporter [Aquibacillus halophilus]MRH43730.1 MFS transporter [Aquibacillus halophilus]